MARLETRVYELCNGRYRNLSELARAMGIATSQIYRVRQGKRRINEKFIIGAIKAVPGYINLMICFMLPQTETRVTTNEAESLI